ncbi:MAG: TonB-dependent receptor [Myxococcales bacterium]|nr:TonB-dependent receptor [Myxococcales bacterium]
MTRATRPPPAGIAALVALALGLGSTARSQRPEDVETPSTSVGDASAAAVAHTDEVDEAEGTGGEATPAPRPEPASDDEARARGPVYGARARVRAPRGAPSELRIAGSVGRDVPGALGDPFRAVESMPGVVSIRSGAPYVYVRGAPPASAGHQWDGIPLPLLFHLALGPAVVHPRMVATMHWYPGVAPARYGRRMGATLEAEAPTTAVLETSSELELRLLDANGYLEVPWRRGELRVAGRYGYPGPLLALFVPGLRLQYWDYQARARFDLGDETHAQLVALGSHDVYAATPELASLGGVPDIPQRDVGLDFHRLEARLLRARGPWEAAGALRVGWDRSFFESDLRVELAELAARAHVEHRSASGHRWRVGVDVAGTASDVVVPRRAGGAPTEIHVDLPALAHEVGRMAAGVHAEASWRVADGTRLQLGTRGDVWLGPRAPLGSADVRLFVEQVVQPWLEVHAGAGTAHQPAVFVVPLPGLSHLPLDDTLGRAWQTEAGLSVSLPHDVRVRTGAFAHHYDRVLLLDTVPNGGSLADEVVPSEARAWGLELFVRRERPGPVRGWLSYTLAWARARTEAYGIGSFVPDFDVRHTLHAVLAVSLGRLELGLRAFAQSGRMANAKGFDRTVPIYAQRLPWFGRIDARLSWHLRWGPADVSVYAEWLNVLLAREPIDARCFFGHCEQVYAPTVAVPNAGLRAQW